MRVVQTQAFRSGFQFIGEPVIVRKFGKEIGMYLPLNDGKATPIARRGRQPVAATPVQIVKRGPGRPKGSRNKEKVTA